MFKVQKMTYSGLTGSLPAASDVQTRPLREPRPPQAQSRCPSSPVVVGLTLRRMKKQNQNCKEHPATLNPQEEDESTRMRGKERAKWGGIRLTFLAKAAG